MLANVPPIFSLRKSQRKKTCAKANEHEFELQGAANTETAALCEVPLHPHSNTDS